jgi:hypothetical protein
MSTTTTTAMAWDPTRPSALQILQKGQVHTLQAGTGTGCHAHELTALIQLIPDTTSTNATATTTTTTPKRTIQETLQHYRVVLSQCIDDAKEDTLDLDLLKLNQAVLHLSEIFLCGSVSTAETVRYVRQHHLSSLQDLIPEYENMVQATQPEQWEGYSSVLMKLVMHGCLEEAWRVLSKHSLYVAATANATLEDREYGRTMREIEHSFLIMRDLLLLAPIPGGRTHFYDHEAERIDEIEAVVLEDLDVHSHDYQFWESAGTSNTSGADVPLTFHADAALRKHKRWQDYVKQVRLSLVRHLPELAPLLAILSGDIREAPCDSWQEAFLVELLYRPPPNIRRRARALAQSFANTKEVDQSLLQVMEGNAGEALHLLYVYGAGTGAALPAVLVSVFE